jgi:hypothetical protein
MHPLETKFMCLRLLKLTHIEYRYIFDRLPPEFTCYISNLVLVLFQQCLWFVFLWPNPKGRNLLL